MNTETYYRMLNWGLRLAAGAASGSGAKQTPVGYNRAYARVDKEAKIADFFSAWAAGRNFVTNGPMLFLETTSGKKPGDTIALPAAGGKIGVKLNALANQPLTRVELVQNGHVVKTFSPQSARKAEGFAELTVNRGSWIAARCVVEDDLLSDKELATYANGKSQQPCRLRFAHTSPIYVTVGGKSAAVRESIEEGFQMLDAFERFAKKTASEKHREEILEAVKTAREKLRGRLE